MPARNPWGEKRALSFVRLSPSGIHAAFFSSRFINGLVRRTKRQRTTRSLQVQFDQRIWSELLQNDGQSQESEPRTMGLRSPRMFTPIVDPPLVTCENLNRFDRCCWFVRVVQRRQKSKPRGAAKVFSRSAVSSWSKIVGNGGVQGPCRFFIVQHRWRFSQSLLRRKNSTRSCWR